MVAKRPAEQKSRKYHHGALKSAFLDAAEQVLLVDGFAGLTLRSIARVAGVSHTAAIHHFSDRIGVLSELAALGHMRLAETLTAYAVGFPPGQERRKQIGRGYIAFAARNPDLFRLMSRNELLDYSRPALQQGLQISSRALAGVENVTTEVKNNAFTMLTKQQAIGMVARWSFVHGLANLLIDGRLNRLAAAIDQPTTPAGLVDEIMQLITMEGASCGG